MKILIVVAAVASRAWFVVPTGAVPAPPGDGPHVSWSGPDGRITERGYRRIATDEAWTTLWLENAGASTEGEFDRYDDPHRIPRVDFEKCTVLAVFLGTCATPLTGYPSKRQAPSSFTKAKR